MPNPVRHDGKFYPRPNIGQGDTIAIIRPHHVAHAKITATGRHSAARIFKFWQPNGSRSGMWHRRQDTKGTAIYWDKFEGIWLATADRSAWQSLGK